MNFRDIKLTNALFGGDMHQWSLCGAYATEDGIELKFTRCEYDHYGDVTREQSYIFTVIEDENNYNTIDMLENDLQQYWETEVEPYIIDHLNSLLWSDCDNDYQVVDELIRIDEVGELTYEQECY